MTVTGDIAFCGGGLNRAAQMRGDAAALARLLAAGRVLPFWRGKPLVLDGAAPGWVGADAPVLHLGAEPVFLGLDPQGGGLFAQDISDWSPEAGAEAVAGGFFDPSVQHHPSLPDRFGFAELRGVMTRLDPLSAEIAASAKAVLQWHRSHRFCSACGAASAPAQGGWQRVCPACAAQHFPRTDPVVIMLVTRGNRLLLGRSPGWPEGMYSTLAGFVEPGETVEAAVRREVAEETGVPVGAVRYVASQPWPFPASLMIGCRAEALAEAITLDPAELEDALWLSREDLVSVLAGSHPRVRPPRKGAIASFLIENWLADRL
jgi:NAD+ diphosphatase